MEYINEKNEYLLEEWFKEEVERKHQLYLEELYFLVDYYFNK